MKPKVPAVGFSPDDEERLVALVRRLNASADLDPKDLINRITDLLRATGHLVDSDEYSQAFRECSDQRPSHKDLAKHYRAIAKAVDPLKPELYVGAMSTEMEQRARAVWSRVLPRGDHTSRVLWGKTNDQFSPQQLSDIREMAAAAATYHAGLAPPGSRQKEDQDTLLSELAEIVLQFAGKKTQGRYDLPHAVTSVFIQFAHTALRPFFPATEASADALSKRWKRYKRQHKRKPGPSRMNSFKPAPKRLKTRPKKAR